jgi:hypothetical protein
MTQRSERIVLAYTPDDLYYIADVSNVPRPSDCSKNFATLSPYQQQLCLNQNQAVRILERQKVHAVMEKKMNDAHSKYYNEVLKSFNLGIGILAIISFLYYSQAPPIAAPSSSSSSSSS